MQYALRVLVYCLFALMVTACASPTITKISDDTYQIKASDYRGAFGNQAEFKAATLAEAQKFADASNKILVPISIQETPMRAGRFYGVDYTFRLANPEYLPIRSADSKEHPLDRPTTVVQVETASQKKARLAAEKSAEQSAAQRMKEIERTNAQAERQRQIVLREQEKERAREERARQVEMARIQREGDGSPDDLACKSYGFKPNSTPYAECRQKIAIQRQMAIQQQQIEMERQRLARIERDRQEAIRKEEADAARWGAVGEILLNQYNRQMDRQYDAVRRQQEQSDRFGDRLWNDNERRMRDSWKW